MRNSSAELLHEAYPYQKDWINDEGNNALHLAVKSRKPSTVGNVLSLGVAITHNHEKLSFFDLIIEIPDSKLAFAAIGSDRWQEVLDLASPNRPHPLVGLIKRLPEVAKMVLDNCHIQSSHDKQDPHFWVKYNFKYLKFDETYAVETHDSRTDKQKEEEELMKLLDQPTLKSTVGSATGEVSKIGRRCILQALRAMIRYNRVSLLTHPV